jgi:GT2 family glycosyltransferase
MGTSARHVPGFLEKPDNILMKTPMPALLSSLCPVLPDWATGMAGRGLLRRHLNQLLSACQTPELADLARRIAHWNWQLLPWDEQAIETCSLPPRHGENLSLPDWTGGAASHTNPYFKLAMQAVTSNQPERVAGLWRSHGATSENIAWLGESCLFFMQHGDTALAMEVLESANIPSSHPVRLYLQALFSFHFGAPEVAIPRIKALPEEWRELRSYLEAECLLRHGDEKGVKMLAALWREIPWHVNLTLKLHDLLAPGPTPATPGADTAVLIYSWNNADLLAKTLQSMADSDLGGATLMILDNGSADQTPSVIETFAKLLGDRLKTMRLQVNIGAPAARNWLLHHPESNRFRNIAFVDDDVLVPRDWLGTLIARKQSAPRHAIVGCRIMDQKPRESVQMADVNLLSQTADKDFQIANTGGGELDLGLHAYSRQCLSVTGCCHLLDRQRAVDLGGFDLRFGPSQFDDFDLDLRNALHGGHAVFAGQAAIRHCQRSSLTQADSEAKQGHLFGNMIKLNTKFSPVQKAELLRRNHELLWDDLLAKTRALENA